MTPDEFINGAIAAGERNGIGALDPLQRLVYLIAEAECLSDMSGIDPFLERYGAEWLGEATAAFEVIGAIEIAAELRSVPANIGAGDPRLDRLNRLITTRAGYDYESIRRVVSERLASSSI